MALSSAPRNLRGKHGIVVIDEAAFHDNLKELIDAALALLTWGGKIRIISTHNGADNAFNDLIIAIRAGKLKYSLHRTTLDDALADGLFHKICEATGRSWSAEAEADWRAAAIAKYPDREVADQELVCIPRRGGGAYIPTALIEQCQSAAVPVLPFLLLSGIIAIVASLTASIVALGLVGAGTSLFTGRGAFFSAARQIAIGVLAALVTYGMGRLAGTALTG